MNFSEFLSHVKEQTEPALVISNNTTSSGIDGFSPISPDFKSLFDALSKGGNFVVQLSSPLPQSTYNLIKQYIDRKDEVSVFTDGSWHKTAINIQTTRLLLVVDTDTLTEIEQEYPMRQIVGMVFEDNQ